MPKILPESVSEIFEPLENDLVRLLSRWDMFLQLYDKGPKRIELLNKIASTFFYELHFLFINDMMLSISRLTDPPESLGRKNLTISRLINTLKEGLAS